MSEEIICIVCPLGCNITVEDDKKVRGNNCERGKEYALKEISNPTRILTTTVKVIRSSTKRLPVKTDGEIPKEKIFKAMDVINKIYVTPPIEMGNVIIKNILDTKVNIVACKSIS